MFESSIESHFFVSYDNNFIELTGITFGPFLYQFGEVWHIIPLLGDYSYIGMLLAPNTEGVWTTFAEGSGTLFTLNFRAKQPGYTFYNPILTVLTDDEGRAIPYSALNCTIKINMLGDINGDNIVDMLDISQAAQAFGAYPTHPRWNPLADVNLDNIVDLKDISRIARNYGKSYI